MHIIHNYKIRRFFLDIKTGCPGCWTSECVLKHFFHIVNDDIFIAVYLNSLTIVALLPQLVLHRVNYSTLSIWMMNNIIYHVKILILKTACIILMISVSLIQRDSNHHYEDSFNCSSQRVLNWCTFFNASEYLIEAEWRIYASVK